MGDETKINTGGKKIEDKKEITLADVAATLSEIVESNKKMSSEIETLKAGAKDESTRNPPVVDKPATSNLSRLTQENVALKKVIAAHNIPFDISKADLSKIVVNDKGEHAGDFEYNPPALSNTAPNAWNHTPGKEITMDDVKKMTPEQINANWDKVEGVLAASANS